MRTLLLIIMLPAVLMQPVLAENLFNADTYQSLTSDAKAHRVGDILTVIVIEDARASTNVGSSSAQDNDYSPRFGWTGNWFSAGVGSKNTTEGSGQTVRNGSVRAQFSVAIKSINKNGDYEVTGQQNINFNGEIQSITLSAFVRPDDIKFDNTVLSNRLYKLDLAFTGNGFVDHAQKQNIFQKFFSYLGL